MNPLDTRNTQGRVSVRLILGILFLGLLPVLLLAAEPTWWSKPGNSIKSTNPANDYAAVNQGQLKNIATAAVAELDANLPGGAGTDLQALVNKWSSVPTSGTGPRIAVSGSNTNDYAAVNIGQLKSVSKPFYDRLIQVGYTAQYPWTTSTNAANDYAMANIGQVKNLFSFDVTSKTDPNNPLPDWWQTRHFGHTGVNPSADADEDGINNLTEYVLGTNPTTSAGADTGGVIKLIVFTPFE